MLINHLQDFVKFYRLRDIKLTYPSISNLSFSESAYGFFDIDVTCLEAGLPRETNVIRKNKIIFLLPSILWSGKLLNSTLNRKKKKCVWTFSLSLMKDWGKTSKHLSQKDIIPWVEGVISTDLSSALRDAYRSISKWIQDCLRSNHFLKVKVDLQRQDIESKI